MELAGLATSLRAAESARVDEEHLDTLGGVAAGHTFSSVNVNFQAI